METVNTAGAVPAAVTQWLETVDGGRERGPVALARAWIEVLVRPQRFFARGVAPGDQAAGLVFLAVVVLMEEGGRVAVGALARRGALSTGPFPYPWMTTAGPLQILLYLLVVVLVVAPAALHLVAALQTVLLIPLAPDRAGVSETVQVIAYATAPCVLAGVHLPAVRLVCALWGAGLLVIGTAVVHDLDWPTATIAAALPALVVFGGAFRGAAALAALL